MIIKNLTSKVQPIKLEELVGGREFTLYVEGNGVTDVVGAYIPCVEEYNGIFEIVGSYPNNLDHEFSNHKEEIEQEEEPKSEENKSEDSSSEQESSKPEVADDKFICDVCGAEFASTRGLASHKNRAHSEE